MTGIPEGEDSVTYKFFKEIAENSPNLVNDTYLKIQDAERITNQINSNNLIPRHIIIKLLKTKEKY